MLKSLKYFKIAKSEKKETKKKKYAEKRKWHTVSRKVLRSAVRTKMAKASKTHIKTIERHQEMAEGKKPKQKSK